MSDRLPDINGYTGFRGYTGFSGYSPQEDSLTVWLLRYRFEMDRLEKTQRRGRAFLFIVFAISALSIAAVVSYQFIY